MTTYAIGDLQGCLDPLKKLLDKIQFDSAKDTLWFAGDLINRGPQSLETLRFVRDLGELAITVLGNHDLHLLAVKAGTRKPSAKDTLKDILEAPDTQELCDWLRRLPLLHHNPELGLTLVHAGLHPAWDLHTATMLAREVERQLAADDYLEFLTHMYGNSPDNWLPELQGYDRLRFAINCFTRMRYVYRSGKLDFSCNGPPQDAPEDLIPWFNATNRQNGDLSIVFGHWSSLGVINKLRIHALDTGCVWGGCLSAMALETLEMTQVSCS